MGGGKSLPILLALAVAVFATTSLSSCSDDVDGSNLYIFKGQTCTGYISQQDSLSYYHTLLKKARNGKRGSTMDHLLETRGHYTVFAPTNDAVQAFLDSVYSTKGYAVDDVSDSLAQKIVANSIIDCGMADALETTDMTEGALPYQSMDARFVLVSFRANHKGGAATTVINAFSNIIVPDIEVSNGRIHVVDRVVLPYSNTLSDLIKAQDNLRIFGHLLEQTAWEDSLHDYYDEEYEQQDIPETYLAVNRQCYVPQHHFTGYTAFVEPDSVICKEWGIEIKTNDAGSVTNWDEIMARVKEVCQEHYPNATSPDLKSTDNAVNQFVGYHLIDGAIPFNKLVIHYNTVGEAFTKPSQLGLDKMQYFTTLGKDHRIIKLTEGEQTHGKRINRYVRKYDWTTYKELDVPRPGIYINSSNGKRDIQALNGFYYPIDEVLWYDSDVPGKVLNERTRWDVLSLQPELMTNGIRCYKKYQNFYIPRRYCKNIVSITDETYFVIDTFYGWMQAAAYEQDEPIILGQFDFTMKLPPVANDGTYELRMRIANSNWRSMFQVYIGDDPHNLTAIGMPIDERLSPTNPLIGWFKDIEDDPAETLRMTKDMHNRGYMKCPASIGFPSYSATTSNRNFGPNDPQIRVIIYKGPVKANKQYYVRFKSVLTNPTAEFDFDFFEWCPKSVYNGEIPEDYF